MSQFERVWVNAGAGAKAVVYSFNGNKIITTSGGGMLVTADAALAAHARKLATQAEQALNDAQRDRLLEKHPGAAFHDLRLTIDLDDRHAGVLAYARALLYWHYRNAHCGFCGAPSRLESAGHRLVCSDAECARESFPRIDPAMIVLVTHGDTCLLGHNPRWPERRYSTLAGYVEPGESLEDAVAREVYEEARVRLADVRYLSSQPWPFPASAMCGFYAEATSRDCAPSDEMEQLRWLSAGELARAIEEDEIQEIDRR